jgi:hypothetical protein
MTTAYQNPYYVLLDSNCYYDGNPFKVYLYSYYNSGLLWVGLIIGSIVLYMILHNLHSACYCGGGVTISWVNSLVSQLLTPCFYHIFGFK